MNAVKKNRSTRSNSRHDERLSMSIFETLEKRTLFSAGATAHALNVPAGLTVGAGLSVSVFATNPPGASQPDSIAVDGKNIFVGYGNGVAVDGSDGKSSTIVEYDTTGAIVNTFSVRGHNDGLKVDPATHLVWAMQNEDANPNLVIINPTTGTETLETFAAPPAAGGGYDDITFLDGKTYLSASNPSANPNTAPAIVQATISGTTVNVTPVLLGDATATNVVTHQKVTLNLQDPDSMTANPAGELVMTSQADDEIVIVKHPGASHQTVSLMPLLDKTGTPVSVDDSIFGTHKSGVMLLTDMTSGTIYQISGETLHDHVMLSAAQDIGELGVVSKTGQFTPVITGLGSPRGLAFLAEKVKHSH